MLHLALGAALLHGLAGEPLRRTGEALATFDVRLPQLAPPPPREASAERRQAGATDLSAQSSTVVPVPKVKLPVTPRLATSTTSATDRGDDAGAGAGLVPGAGTGAGTGGDGSGGGGTGGGGLGEPASEARLVSGNLSRGDYRRIRDFGAPRGEAVLGIEVGTNGRLTRCFPVASSGDPGLDFELCRLLSRTRWEPARNRFGDPVAVALRYVATWDRY
jgi:outer membrane biosynthesis protein TonB